MNDNQFSRRWSLGFLSLFLGGATGASAFNTTERARSLGGITRHNGHVSVKDYGAVGDGVADDTLAIEKARKSGARGLVFPSGKYRLRNIVIDQFDNIQILQFEPGTEIHVIAGRNVIGLDIQKPNISIVGAVEFISQGAQNDGLNMVGIRHGTPDQGQSYLHVSSYTHRHFSGHGFLSWGAVYLQLDRVVGFGSRFGITLERLIGGRGKGNGASVVIIGSSYQSGCDRGIYVNGAGWVDLRNAVFEYCGANGGAALYLVNCSGILTNVYGEDNHRNLFSEDSSVQWIGGAMLAAKQADTIKYGNIAHSARGSIKLQGNTVSARFVEPDISTGFDLKIGDITVPAGGGATQFGLLTTQVIKGTAVSGQWTTVKILDGQSGSGDKRISYSYAIFAGSSDLTTGYDSGTILNGVIYSHTGRQPDWLRISQGILEIKINSRKYGLCFGCHLQATNPIAL